MSSSIPSNAWSTNNFTYGAFESGDIDNVPLLDIVRGNIILAELDGSGNISNNPTAFFILTTSKINNINNFPNVPATAYQQFMLVQGNSKNFGPTIGGIPNGQDDSKFYFTPFSSQVIDLVPLYAKYNSDKGGIEFFRADIFLSNPSDEDSFTVFMRNNPGFRPNINSLPNPIGQNETNFVYLCTTRYREYSIFIYSEFLTLKDILVANSSGVYYAYQTVYNLNEMKNNTVISVGIKYTQNEIYMVDGPPGGVNLNFLTSLGGTSTGGSSNNTNINMGFINSNVFYQNIQDNYIGTFFNDDSGGSNGLDWSIPVLTYDIGITNAGLTNNMVFQFIPLNYLVNPGFNNVSQAPSYLNSGNTFPYPPSTLLPPVPYPTSLPNVKTVYYVNPSTLIDTIYNWYGNPQSVSCSTKIISSSYCGFTSQYYYNSLQGYFYDLKDITCGASFDPPELGGFSPSCNGYYGPGTQSVCVPNFESDINTLASPFVCGPDGKTFSATDYYGMTYDNFINYFSVLPPTGIPYSLTSFKPRPYIDTEKVSQNTEGTPKTTFWNSSVFIVLAVLFLIIIIGIVIYFIYKQSKKNEPFSKSLRKYYS